MQKNTMKLLLIEDDEDDVIIAQDLLAEIPNQEFEVTWINDYDDALFSMLSNQYDIVLLDYRLGPYNGIDLLKEANKKGCQSPVILLTGQDDYDVDVESMNAGASDYHVKGRVDVNSLERSIRYAVDRKRSESDLKQSEEKFRSLAESAIDGVLTMDENGKVVFCNNAAEIIFECNSDELLSTTIEKLVPGISLEKHQEKLAQVKEIKEDEDGELVGNSIEAKGIKKNGHNFPVEVSLSSWETRDGKFLTAFLRDVTKRKGLEQRVRQVQKMEAIGTLAGGIAHDFNNILGSIMGYTEMAIEDIPAGSFTRNYLENVLTASERAKELVGQILTFSRLDEQEKKSVRVDLVVKETLKLLRASIPATINIIQNIDTEDSYVLGDTNQIHQLVLNLCTNASHAMQSKGKGWLYINLREQAIDEATIVRFPGLKPGRYVQLEVADTGHGIEKSVISRIFDPFFTTKNVGEGTGMGLAVVHGIVKNLGGEISVESQVDKGTTFRVFLPCVNELSGATKEDKHIVTKGNERILFVDDESSLVEIASTKLRELGYTVQGQTKSKEALAEFVSKSGDYDLVITDYSMPAMTGIELAKEIYKKRPELPVILCTGYSDAILEKQARKLGVRALVNKPIRVKDLPEVVRRVLDKSYIEEFVVL